MGHHQNQLPKKYTTMTEQAFMRGMLIYSSLLTLYLGILTIAYPMVAPALGGAAFTAGLCLNRWLDLRQ